VGRALDNPEEMKIIYEASKDVFDGKYSVQYALLNLQDKVSGTDSSLKMYFNIYSCMRKAKCYKMGTSESFTKFLLLSIFEDFGEVALKNAISAVMGNYTYRESVNNTQPGLLRACEDAIKESGCGFILSEIPAAPFDASTPSESSIKQTPVIPGVHAEKVEYKLMENVQQPVDYTITDENGNEIELNIQPAASILNVFSRLSYKPWYAIAEFVDNSTQSYISHANELAQESTFDKLIVVVKYNQVTNTLTITDNAFGMEIERFKDAILLDSRNSTQSGRNEFGMGLKTAASWFGNVWTVTSTQYGSANRYTATVDIPKLKEYGLNSIHIHRDYVVSDTHGTEIVIEQVTKKITGSRTIGKIRDLLSSMYRRDINGRNIEIWFNDEPIVFEEYPVLTNFRGRSWKKDLDFIVEFNGNQYNVTGFVAIMNPGSFPKAGFALFRQDRVVVGGTDANYKPAQIFGQAQSQRSLKLFGELNMNDFPVNQAKDGFIWDDGLEDAFIEALKENIQEYIEIANLSIKERADESQYSDSASEELQQDVAEALQNVLLNDEEENTEPDSTLFINDEEIEDEAPVQSDVQEYIDTVLNADVQEEIVGTPRQYRVPLTPIMNVEFTVQWSVGNRSFWIEYTEVETDKYDVLINIDHPFFMPFSKDEEFKRVLEKFTLAFILAERQAKLSSNHEGYVPSNVIKNYMNRFLEKLAEE